MMLISRAVLALGLLSASTALAHGGEDHGAPAKIPSTGLAGAGAGATGNGDAFELLLRGADVLPGRDASLTVFASDLLTNAPVSSAVIELEFSGPSELTVTAHPGGEGTYTAHAKLGAGTYSILATVTSGDVTDLVTLSPWVVGPAKPDFKTPVGSGALIALLGGLVLLAIAGRLLLRGRRHVALITVCLLGTAQSARAHGGEVHAGDAAPAASVVASGPGIVFPKESQFLLGILTVPVARQPLESRTILPGRILPRTNGAANVISPFAGRLDPSVPLALPGERVRKGQLLAIVEQNLGGQERLQLGSEQVRLNAELAQAEAELEQATIEAARLQSLQGVVSEKEILAARTELAQVRQRAEGLRRSLGLFGRGTPAGRWTRIRIVAPIEGVISDVTATLGQQVDAQAKLFTIVDASVVWIEASVFPSDLGKVAGLRTAAIRVEAFPDRWVPARLLSLGATVDPATQTVRATFEAVNAEGILRPGMYADVAMGAGRATELLAVPDSAVVESEGRRLVYVKLGPELFESREVVLGGRDGALWEVKRGLTPGEKVVVTGTYQLRSAKGGL